MLTNGSTAMDLAGIVETVSSCKPVPFFHTKVLVSSSTTAVASTTMIARSSLRPVDRVMDASAATSLSRLNPCGVNS